MYIKFALRLGCEMNQVSKTKNPLLAWRHFGWFWNQPSGSCDFLDFLRLFVSWISASATGAPGRFNFATIWILLMYHRTITCNLPIYKMTTTQGFTETLLSPLTHQSSCCQRWLPSFLLACVASRETSKSYQNMTEYHKSMQERTNSFKNTHTHTQTHTHTMYHNVSSKIIVLSPPWFFSSRIMIIIVTAGLFFIGPAAHSQDLTSQL